MKVRTRFAPSPTGYLHIGGVRTALFNWLFARRHGGQFLLRIDDTDAERNVEAALAPILHGFRWLGIDWDEGPEKGGRHAPYYQSQRLARYQAAVEKLLAAGLAYRDFASPDEIQLERETAQAEKRPFLYSRRWMADTPAQEKAFAAEGRQSVVRLKMPREGSLVIDDLVRGRVEFEWAREQDHVIQRADGTCLYHLASVVDDFDFEISHVIRAEEHLSNTPRQIFIAQSLDYPLPAYAHLPYVAEPGSKNKLSKRKLDKYLKNRDFALVNEHGLAIARAMGLETSAETFNPVIVDFYEQVGYLPDAIINYLLLLGWSLDDKTEFMSRKMMIENFSLERVTKAPASFDPKKLWAFEDHYMQQMPLKQKVSAMLDYLQRARLVQTPAPCDVGPKLTRIVEAAGDRLKVLGDILAYADFFFQTEVHYDEKAFEKSLRKPGAAELLSRFRHRIAKIEPFDVAALEAGMQAFVAEENIKIADIVHSVRVATTGKPVGPGLYDCLEILGKPVVLERIERALDRLRSEPQTSTS
ncbi:MAG TPA: glutamate--tRNA ligase [Pirellulales bacterium]|jgi:glutamyl-tRNA synthetase|nr:glutamate--tRNA ligase [Pirellulales bacterium]